MAPPALALALLASGCAWVTAEELLALEDGCGGDTGPASCDGTWYIDIDGDGYGSPDTTREGCDPGPGWVVDATDCDDADSNVHPGATEICGNGLDDDCDGVPTDCRREGDLVPDRSWEGTLAGGRAGTALISGDWNGDGFDDLVVGAPDALTEDGTTGALYVVPGPDLVPGDLSEVGAVIRGRTEGGRAGISLALAGDLDEDGSDDFVVGQDGGADGSTPAGIFILDDGLLSSYDLESGSRVVIPTFDHGIRFGAAVAAGEDASGDGVADVLVGAPRGPGMVCLLPGPLLEVPDWDSITGWILGDSLGYLGASLALPGDVDGDGLGDLLLGASPPGVGGEVLLVLGPLTALVFQRDADVVLVSTDPEDGLGVVAGLGDIDGDGLADVGIGAPFASGGAGTAWVLAGDPSDWSALTDAWIEVSGSGTEAAGSALAVGDLDDDGWPDLSVGSPGAAEGDGQISLFYGPFADAGSLCTSDADLRLRSPSPGGGAGASLVAADLDADGTTDLALGAPDAHAYAGAVAILLGLGL